MEQQDTLLHTTTGSLGVSLLVGIDGFGGVFLRQMDVAHGVIHLVKIVLVLVGGSHAAQLSYHLLGLSLGRYLRHGYAGIELQLIGRVLGDDLSERFVRLVVPSQCRLDLPHEVPFACLLLFPALVLDDFSQVGDGLFQLSGVDIVVGKGVVPLFRGPPVDAVAPHVAYHVLGIVEPILLNVALGEPCACLSVDGGLGLINPRHVGKRCRRLVE